MQHVPTVTVHDFTDRVLGNPLLVLVDFSAAWCGPCRQVAPHLEALAVEYAGRAEIVKVDIDESPTIAAQYGIQSVPTLLLFQGGQQEGVLIGAKPKPAIASLIESCC